MCFVSELGVTGTQLPTRNSAKDKARLEESMVLQKLRDEGLISKPAAEKSGGVSFEIFEVKSTANSDQRALPALPPLKLAKLEKRRKKKKSLTEEEIKEKLQRAELRRKVCVYFCSKVILFIFLVMHSHSVAPEAR